MTVESAAASRPTASLGLFPPAGEKTRLPLTRGLFGQPLPRVVDFHLPPRGRGGCAARSAAFGRIVNLDPRRRVRCVNIDPPGPLPSGFDLFGPRSEKIGGGLAIGGEDGGQPLTRCMYIPRPRGSDHRDQRVHPFPGEKPCERSAFRHLRKIAQMRDALQQGWKASKQVRAAGSDDGLTRRPAERESNWGLPEKAPQP